MTCNSSTIFLDSFQRLQPKIVPRLTISSNMIFNCKVKKADKTFIFFLENESRYFVSVGVNRESLIQPKIFLRKRKAALGDAE